MPKGVPSAGKRVAQFDKPYICQRCGLSGFAATSKRKFCSRCKSAVGEERRAIVLRAAALDSGRAIGQAFACPCGAPVVRTSSGHRFCEPCRMIQRRRRVREWQRAKNSHEPLGTLIACQGCMTPVERAGGLQKFCPACRRESQRRSDREGYRARQPRPIAIIGDVIACEGGCGTKVERRGAGQKFCLPCAKKHRAKLGRAVMAKRRKEPKHRLNLNVSSAICRSIKVGGKGGRKWQVIVGFDLAELMAHLEPQFQRGMTWSNHGKWHIDHIRPLCSFEFQTPDDPQFREAWALTNLRPLWARDNLSKGGRHHLLL
jgi:hypothetical protein